MRSGEPTASVITRFPPCYYFLAVVFLLLLVAAEYGLWPVLNALKIPRCGLHAFRHTHASLLLDSGATPKVVQEQLRHADPRMTLGVYGHVLGDARTDAVEKVASIVFRDVPKAIEEGKYIQ